MLQQSLFGERPTLNIIKDVKGAMIHVYQKSGLSREEVVEKMNDVAERFGVALNKGKTHRLTLATLDKWLNINAIEHYPTLRALPIYCEVMGSFLPIQKMVQPLGGEIITPEDKQLLEWARAFHAVKRAKARMKQLEP